MSQQRTMLINFELFYYANNMNRVVYGINSQWYKSPVTFLSATMGDFKFTLKPKF